MTDVLAPVAGLVRPLSEVPDPVFAAEMVGAGVAIEPDATAGVVDAVSPVAGAVLKLHPHAFVVLTPEGAGILVHLGIDTVRLGGAGFELLVQEKAQVEAGQPVTRWNPADVVARGLSPMVLLCVLDTKAGAVTSDRMGESVVAGQSLFRLARPHVTGPRLAALLLDLDGTLVDSEPLHRARYRAWFAHRGWPYDDAVAARFTGRRADDVFRTVDGPWRGQDPDALLAEIVALEPHRRLPEPVAGAAEAVAWARAAGIPLALVTSATTLWAGKALEALSGIGAFDATVTRDDIATGKPDPACYALACERLGVAAVAAAACEDAPDGVRSAVGAGVGVVVGVTTSFTQAELRDAGATSTLPDLTGLPALLTGRG